MSISTTTVNRRAAGTASIQAALAAHWPEYVMEGLCLGVFLLSACAFTALLEHPASPVNQALESAAVRRVLMGLAMGGTALALVTSRWGQRSGAHLNPAVTLTYLSLGKVAWPDALFYILAQFAGAVLGVWAAELLIGMPLSHSAVNYAVTQPGPDGPLRAFGAEILISGLLMAAVLATSNHRRFFRYTPYLAAGLVALYITLEAPVSGMSMNPARTLGSGFAAGSYSSLWIYFTAPPLAMLAAGQLYRLFHGAGSIYCAKLHHNNTQRCIFRCRHHDM